MSRVRVLLALALAAGALAGCGGDDEEATVTTTVPPVSETAPPPATTGSSTTSTSTGGGVSPDEDSEANDLPPEPGSGAEQFENRCERKPESCD